MHVTEQDVWLKLYSYGPSKCPAVGSCKHSNETSRTADSRHSGNQQQATAIKQR